MSRKLKIFGAAIFLIVFIGSYINIFPKDNPIFVILMPTSLIMCAIGFYMERKENEKGIIIINAKIYTMDKNNTIANAVYINNRKIIDIGNNKKILSYKKEGMKLIDANKKTIIPGLIDSHMHLLGYGQYISSLVLSDVKSIDDIIKKSKQYIKKNKINKDKWLIVKGLNDEQLIEKRMPTKDELDSISLEIPIIIKRTCYHSMSCNSKALEIAGIDENTYIEGGKVEKDENGNPNGILREAAMELVDKNIPEPTITEIKNILDKALKEAVKNGLTGIHTDDFSTIKGEETYEKIIEAYNQLEEDKKLPVRIYEQCLFHEVDKLKEFNSSGYKTGVGSEMFKIGPLKILADGSLGSRTAYLSEPYKDDPENYGSLTLKPEEIDELVKTAHDNNMPVAIHAIGDKAAEIAIESIKKAQSSNYKEDIRHGIVHFQITNENIFKEVKKNKIITFIQPIFVGDDYKIIDSRIGEERAKTSYNWKTLNDMDIIAPFGTDCPVDSLNPFHNIYCAVTRQDIEGNPEGGWLPEQKMTVYEAVKGYTINSAYASYDEDKRGTIEVDKYADMILISDNIFEVEPQYIKDIQCEMTIVDGKIVYKQ